MPNLKVDGHLDTFASEYALEFDGVSFFYGEGIAALEDVSFSIIPGEFVSVAGLNGSGKSTAAKLADALLSPNKGNVSVFGVRTDSEDGTYAARRHIGYVFQDPAAMGVATIVEDEVAFGPENLGLPDAEIKKRVRESLDAVGMQDNLKADLNTLSGGQLQRVALASALAMHPEILILDEATSMLDRQGAHDVMAAIRNLNSQGITVLNITHSEEEVRMGEHLLVLDGGRLVYDGAPDTEIMDRLFPPLPDRKSLQRARESHTAPCEDTETLISMENVSFAYGSAKPDSRRHKDAVPENNALNNVTLKICKGESVFVTGPNGSGKSTLLKLMNGLLKPTAGTVEVKGVDTRRRAGADNARKVCGLCFQYPERQLFSRSVYDDIAFGPRAQRLHAEQTDSRVRNAMEKVGLDFNTFAARSPFLLSGGQQRRVAIAGVLALEPEVLILDEPCAGLDRRSHAAFLEMLADMLGKGLTLVCVTHDRRDADALADRIIDLE